MIRSRTLPLFAVLLAACGPDASDATARSAPADSATPSAAAVSAAGADSTSAAPAEGQQPVPVLLEPNGVQVMVNGNPLQLSFGFRQVRVAGDVTSVLGEPKEQRAMEECPSGPLYQVSYANGLELNFSDSVFVGWFAREGSALQSSLDGVGPGSTVAQLRAADPAVKLEETSLGWEFAARELYGIVTDTTATGAVQVMFAGINCIFR